MKKQLFLLLALLVACDTIYAADGLFDRKKARKRRKARKTHLPLWKQRAMEREEGKTGTHADRRMRD